ncbi:short-chain dehydrogenase [Arcobacter sp. CECT 8983]|uniref:SDR family NAD(P)-dependent oxidoreductase n=1 Tax=Arcobacter sp. CECT 8983 TaxID=2044508 RepID=UPI00100C3172|nr:SDR family NAD(P)-dependent oxidoreductase [Arcobacter sp. CECT 8983]RXJ89056.1 short-chain dehydrogenase [Arcobacter sp. CECT 8983]
MNKNILITGCSSGLGLALTKLYLEKGYKVFGISRRKPKIEHKNFFFKEFDLSKIESIKIELSTFITNIKEIDTVFLNAGMLGEIKEITKLETKEIQEVLNLNVFANKELLDILATLKTNTVVGISSGASKNGSKGWGSYSLSKSSLNMLLNLYAKEMLDTKLLAIAPGVIETPMTDYIRFDIDDEIFTSAKKLKNGEIQKPEAAAKRLFEVLKTKNEFESGSFIDVRNI